MPNRALHRELTRLVVGITGDDAHDVLDSTAKIHGSHHRSDPVHSLGGAAVELAKKGKLTPENLQAVALHLASDEAFSRIYKTLPKTAREGTKLIIEDSLVRMLKRRRYGYK